MKSFIFPKNAVQLKEYLDLGIVNKFKAKKEDFIELGHNWFSDFFSVCCIDSADSCGALTLKFFNFANAENLTTDYSKNTMHSLLDFAVLSLSFIFSAVRNRYNNSNSSSSGQKRPNLSYGKVAVFIKKSYSVTIKKELYTTIL
jgi:hypothetical protein